MNEGPETVTAGSRILPPPDQRVVQIFEALASAAKVPLSASHRILDFGAGAGRHVAEFRDAGYQAWGVDQIFTSHAEGSSETKYLKRVNPPDYRLPFESDEFNFVYSTSVMEHVTDPGGALREISRVLRPGGLSVHVFPSRWRLIEPHMYIPLGGRFQNYWAMRFWAELGIRSEAQEGLAARETALLNVQYCKTGINYPTAREWKELSTPLFTRVGWDEATFVRTSQSVSAISKRIAPLMGFPVLPTLYRAFHTRVLVLIK